MSILSDHLDTISKDDLATHHHKLLDLCMLTLDFRVANHMVSLNGNIRPHLTDKMTH